LVTIWIYRSDGIGIMILLTGCGRIRQDLRTGISQDQWIGPLGIAGYRRITRSYFDYDLVTRRKPGCLQKWLFSLFDRFLVAEPRIGQFHPIMVRIHGLNLSFDPLSGTDLFGGE
jgi:hypothetical protein